MVVSEKTQFVVFGASGNLTTLKIVPAFYHMAEQGNLPTDLMIWGVARKDWTTEKFLDFLRSEFEKTNRVDDKVWNSLIKHIGYLCLDLNDPLDLDKLAELLKQSDKHWQTESNKLFYFALPQDVYTPLLQSISKSRLAKICNSPLVRILVEKPLGRDSQSAVELNDLMLSVFNENQIFRMDHVLGRNALRDIVSLKTQNLVISKLISPELIESIQVSYLEKIGIGKRSSFYETTGVVRDMLQSHLLEILAEVLMDSFSSEGLSINEERVKIISALEPVAQEDLVIGQYSSGKIDEESVIDYRSEEGVIKDSRVPTYVAVKTSLNLPGWENIPIFFRTGKRLKNKFTEITIVFKPALGSNSNNLLTFRIHPQEGIFLVLYRTKNQSENSIPGSTEDTEQVLLEYCYRKDSGYTFGTPYENLFWLALQNERSSFADFNEIAAAWRFIDPINQKIEKQSESISSPTLEMYKAGSWGPSSAEELMKKYNSRWHTEFFNDVCKI